MRWALERLAPAGTRGRLTSLIFHRVMAVPDPLIPTETYAALFDSQIAWLTRWFNVLPLADAIQGVRTGKLPARAAVVTFDDGFADNCEVALPILRRHGCSATFFIAAGFLDGGRMWNDTVIEVVRACSLPSLDLGDLELGVHALDTVAARRAAIEALIPKIKYREPAERLRIVGAIARRANVSLTNDSMLTSAQLRSMHAAGMTIGAHTMTHPILLRLSDDEAMAEIRGSRDRLQEILGAPVKFFAYPNGQPGQDYDARHVRMVQALGFEAAFSTVWGSAPVGTDLYQLPRFTPWDRTPLRFMLRMAHNLKRDPIGLAA